MSTTPVTPKVESLIPVQLITAGHFLTHYFYIVLIIAGAFMAHVWLSEHDARLVAEQTVKVSQQHEKDLEAQIVTLHSVTASQIQAVHQRVAAIKTPAAAVAAIPELATLPLSTRTLPQFPNEVIVNAVQLAQQLGSCREDHIELGACRQTIVLKDELIAEDKKQIIALKEKPKFWARVSSQGKAALIGGILVEGLRIFLTGRP